MTAATLDACLCLLLISGAAATVATAPGPTSTPADDADRADAVAETLTATTAEFSYRLQPVPGSRTEGNPEFERAAHGTLASLLADAAVRTVHVEGETLTGTSEPFAAAVRETVAERLPPRTRVVVRWEPIADSHLGRQFTVGPEPPTDADVHAESVRAPSGVDSPTDAVLDSAANGGFDTVATVVAESIVAGLLPPEKGRLALGDDPPLDDLVRHRYRRADEVYGVDTTRAIERGDTEAANERIAAAIAGQLDDELRRDSENPDAATTAIELEHVEISVRTWSP